jgi:predicted O-linked N-acetylglucosamine transferase (SPINDLY family)
MVTEGGRDRQQLLRASALWQAGQTDKAETLLRSLLASNPKDAEALVALADLLGTVNRHAEAIPLLEKLVARHPHIASHARRLGVARLVSGDHDRAVAALDQAVRIEPANARGHNNLGEAYVARGEIGRAIDCYRRSILCDPNYVVAHNNLGRALLRANRFGEAVESLERAITLAPTLIAAQVNFSAALMMHSRGLRKAGQYAAARGCLERGLELSPRDINTMSELGALLGSESEYAAAIPIYERLAAIAPDHPYVNGYRLFLKLLCSNWSGFDADLTQIRNAAERGERACTPLQSHLLFDSPGILRRCAETFVHDRYPEVKAGSAVSHETRTPNRPIRVAYLSGDFGDHPVSHLLAGVLECHDESQFEVWVLGWGAHRGAMRTRIEQAVSRFIDVSAKEDADVARLLRDSEVDIAIDLMGHTRDQRTQIFAHRAAPIQVNYLGFPGSMGASFMDYVIADGVVVPEGEENAFAESIVRLPHSYLPGGDRRDIASRAPRAEAGLPAEGFVFCAFNNTFKITPRWFGIWMRLLKDVPAGVLWLRSDDPTVKANLRRAAADSGVAPDRLIFAGRLASMAQHLARYRSADLFLDTLPYNAHATACDALAAGLPVLTCRGSTFPGRVGSSLLTTLGLGELIAQDAGDYERRARDLAQETGRLAAIRASLEQRLAQSPLFDPASYCRRIETAYRRMWQRRQEGLAPAGFTVDECPRSGPADPED